MPSLLQINRARGGDPAQTDEEDDGSGSGPRHPAGMGQAIVNNDPGGLRGDVAMGGGGNNRAAAVAAPAGLGDYASQYEQSLAASRQQIEHQIGAALADINAKEARSSQAVGLLPGQLNTVYDQGNASLAAGTHALDAAQHASGLQSYMGAGAQMAPLAAAVAGDRSSRMADVPLLNIGLAQQAASEHSALQQQRLAAYADLDNQNRQYLMSQAQQQAQFAHEDTSQTHGADLALRNAIAQSQVATASKAQNYGLLVTPAAGASMAQTDPAHAASLRGSPAYVNVVQTLRGLGGAKVNAMLNDPSWLQGFMSGNPQFGGTGASLSPQAISLALYDAGYKP